MNYSGKTISSYLALMLLSVALAGCGGGGSSSPAASPSPEPVPAPPPEPIVDVLTQAEAGRFLSQATFGPNLGSINALVESGLESWITNELDKPPTLHLQDVLSRFLEDGSFLDEQGNPLPEVVFACGWRIAN